MKTFNSLNTDAVRSVVRWPLRGASSSVSKSRRSSFGCLAPLKTTAESSTCHGSHMKRHGGRWALRAPRRRLSQAVQDGLSHRSLKKYILRIHLIIYYHTYIPYMKESCVSYRYIRIHLHRT